jgi:chloride channel protein, CIC family
MAPVAGKTSVKCGLAMATFRARALRSDRRKFPTLAFPQLESNLTSDERLVSDQEGEHGSLLMLAILALIVGAASGFVGALFLLSLQWADRFRIDIIVWSHSKVFAGFLVVTVVCGAATAAAAWLVSRYSPHASGSGIPHVEAVVHGQLPQAPFRIIPAKFVGGLLAIGAGLALGREGPTVQMAATVGHLVGKVFRRNWPDCRVLLAAAAGAGLATAFNAPIAGAIFVLEELVRRFELRVAIAALGASATAISVSRLFLGDAADFHVEELAYAGAAARPLYFVLGAAAGFAAIVYNRLLLGTIAAVGRLDRWLGGLRAPLIGAAVGLLAWFVPDLVGGGDAITQHALAGRETFALLPIIFLFRLCLGAISYAAGTPGGLFAPMLVLGAQLGLFFGQLCQMLFPDLNIQPEGFAVVGMVAFFVGVVRAPLTGIALVVEMTANVTMLLPMLGACFMAMLVPTLMSDPPIYDSLREKSLERERIRLGQREQV